MDVVSKEWRRPRAPGVMSCIKKGRFAGERSCEKECSVQWRLCRNGSSKQWLGSWLIIKRGGKKSHNLHERHHIQKALFLRSAGW